MVRFAGRGLELLAPEFLNPVSPHMHDENRPRESLPSPSRSTSSPDPMTDYAALARLLTSTLGPVSAISVSFLDAPPQGIGKFDGTVPSGCSFWKLANEGRSFYTVPSDHYNCPIGSYTHAIDLPDGRAAELTGTIELMTGIGYIRAEEVPGIPRLPRSPAAVAYGPLARATITPDVVIVKGQPGSLMRLQEAAMGAGAASTLPLFGRPTCMALPASMASGTVLSAGCVGNRVYTGLKDDELYLMIPGARLADVIEQLSVTESANTTLAEYHTSRRATLTS
jgi:uncharacterized protein (DUF169 family)